ncbi:MAG: hypothetical protein ABFE16_02385 [Armatimonadia bacterium]
MRRQRTQRDRCLLWAAFVVVVTLVMVAGCGRNREQAPADTSANLAAPAPGESAPSPAVNAEATTSEAPGAPTASTPAGGTEVAAGQAGTAPKASTGSPAAKTSGAKPKPATGGAKDSAAKPWRVPEGPLNDDKFAAMTAKYTVAVLKLSEKERSNETVMAAVLGAILKEAGVTIEQFTAYADKVKADAKRREKVTQAVEKMVREHAGPTEKGQ